MKAWEDVISGTTWLYLTIYNLSWQTNTSVLEAVQSRIALPVTRDYVPVIVGHQGDDRRCVSTSTHPE